MIEAWSDESTFTVFRDARYDVRPDGAPLAARRLRRSRADGAWPDPAGMVDQLHERGVKVLLWQIPLVEPRPTAATTARSPPTPRR